MATKRKTYKASKDNKNRIKRYVIRNKKYNGEYFEPTTIYFDFNNKKSNSLYSTDNYGRFADLHGFKQKI